MIWSIIQPAACTLPAPLSWYPMKAWPIWESQLTFIFNFNLIRNWTHDQVMGVLTTRLQRRLLVWYKQLIKGNDRLHCTLDFPHKCLVSFDRKQASYREHSSVLELRSTSDHPQRSMEKTFADQTVWPRFETAASWTAYTCLTTLQGRSPAGSFIIMEARDTSRDQRLSSRTSQEKGHVRDQKLRSTTSHE